MNRSDRINEVCGIPVVFDPDSRLIADARGFWPFPKKIAVGPAWILLPHRERMAVLYHEAEHCHRKHFEKRLIMLPLLFVIPEWTRRKCREQEIEADQFAAANGFGLDLARLLNRTREPESMFYPSFGERVSRLRREECSNVS